MQIIHRITGKVLFEDKNCASLPELLRSAYLQGANLRGANLRGANLRGAHMQDADLQDADLRGCLNLPELSWTVVPSEGDIVVYKKLNEGVCKLMVPAKAQRLNATTRKCRAEYAIVLELPAGVEVGHSVYDPSFEYKVGATVKPTMPFCKDRWEECSPGIHFFITRQEAENY